MKKFRLVAVAAVATVVTLLSAGAAHAGGPYSEPAITITIGGDILYGGDSFTYTASAGSVVCNWTITYNDTFEGVPHVQTGHGTSLSGSYKTKKVSAIFKSPIKAVCSYDDGKKVATNADTGTLKPAFYSTAHGASTLQAVTQTAAASATVTLLPRGSTVKSGSALPDTGGSNLSLILLGGGLLLVGGGVTYAARRRSSTH